MLSFSVPISYLSVKMPWHEQIDGTSRVPQALRWRGEERRALMLGMRGEKPASQVRSQAEQPQAAPETEVAELLKLSVDLGC